MKLHIDGHFENGNFENFRPGLSKGHQKIWFYHKKMSKNQKSFAVRNKIYTKVSHILHYLVWNWSKWAKNEKKFWYYVHLDPNKYITHYKLSIRSNLYHRSSYYKLKKNWKKRKDASKLGSNLSKWVKIAKNWEQKLRKNWYYVPFNPKKYITHYIFSIRWNLYPEVKCLPIGRIGKKVGMPQN